MRLDTIFDNREPLMKKKRPLSKLPFKVTTLVPDGQEKMYEDDSFTLPSIRNDMTHQPLALTTGPRNSFDFRSP